MVVVNVVMVVMTVIVGMVMMMMVVMVMSVCASCAGPDSYLNTWDYRCNEATWPHTPQRTDQK